MKITVYKNIPAIAALSNDASAPAITALNPNLAMSGLRFGAREPNPPNNIAIELKFAKPHRAKLTTRLVLAERFPMSSVKAL